ncbi:MAG: hypothetical protein ACRYHQ_04970, partial [Janthinobacterium lividum]
VLPYDRTIALACTLPALRARWLYVRCTCGASHGLPISLAMQENPAAARWTLADLVVRVWCKECRGKALTVHLTEDHRAPGPQVGGPLPEWALLLHGEVRGATRPDA